MSDLRDRIAAAIRAVDDMRVCKLSDADIKFIVEAVICELGLRKVTDVNRSVPQSRYITEWELISE